MTEDHAGLTIRQTMLWLSVGTVAYFFAQWLLTIVVVRLGSTQIAGDYALVLSSSGIFYSISLFGMRTYHLSDVRQEYTTGNYYAARLLAILVALLSGIVFCLASTFTALQKICLLVFLLFRVSESGMDVVHCALQTKWRMDVAGRSLILRGSIELVLFTVLLFLTRQLFWALVGLMLFSMTWLLSYEYRATRKINGFLPRLMLDPKANANLGKLFVACLPLLAGNLAYSFIFYEPRYYIERIYGTPILGVYASIAAPALIMPMLASYIFTPFMPRMSTLYQEGRIRDLNRLFLRLYAVITGLSAIILAAAALLGKWGLAVIFGTEVAQENALLLPIVLSLVFVTYYYYLNAVIVSIRKTNAIYFSAGIGILACVLTSGWMVQRFGPNGASYALMLSQFLQVVFLNVYYSVSTHKSQP